MLHCRFCGMVQNVAGFHIVSRAKLTFVRHYGHALYYVPSIHKLHLHRFI